MAVLTAVQRLLALTSKGFVEYVGVLVGGAASAFQIPALNAAGQLDVTMMPTGVGPDTQQLPASEAIAAGNQINVYSNGGTATMRNADGSTTGKEAHGFVLSAVAAGGQGTAYFSGINTAVTGLTPGPVFLSDTAPGGVAAAGATTAGHTFQLVGEALSPTALQFAPGAPVTRA